ncbi:hypothetical protein LTR56_012854 [Elasticomyces elasticus]|nr:hypothetical protein LTR56_012854 [Elasticomyces elasticus]KAK3650780.1 hypothetical protein LTR22_012379 [Elasticomyces elasticus]KAK4918484.1 hypothetical protein LTR49_013717 [Elasticomyces elasticus]KAK5757877.1 hypothetical protein LTS12_012061 [Elasticomyces elasticus]
MHLTTYLATALFFTLSTAIPNPFSPDLAARSATCAEGGKSVGGPCGEAYQKGQHFACGDHRVSYWAYVADDWGGEMWCWGEV